jgi:L-threonylcarbamoyladenylate synthase
MGRIWEWREAEADALFEAAKKLVNAGRIIGLPTETFYALAAHPFQEAALETLFALKERPPEKPVLLLVANPEMLPNLVASLPEAAVTLIKHFWPGPLTLILPARPDLPPLLSGGTGAVGVRQPRHPVTCRLIHDLGYPVTGTSANRSGQPPLIQAQEVDREFGEAVPLIVDAGPCPGGLPSTIVDLNSSPPRLVRPGAVGLASLQEVIPDIV